MPYTPPTQSPVSSAPETPSISRSHSYSESQPEPLATSPPRPQLVKSTSYLQRHRRTPSLNAPPSVSVDASRAIIDWSGGEGASSHSSGDRRGVNANGAVTTPPDSSQNSSDDEEDGPSRPRGRDTDKFEELEAVVRTIEQRREGSPERVSEEVRQLELALECLQASTEDGQISPTQTSPRASLSQEARKISHSRSSTEPSITFEAPAKNESPFQGSDDSDEERLSRKPIMVRKKSGELVKPALRPPSVRRRPSSMPGTPTYSKAVHFDSHLEHIRHFLQVDRPLAVSAGSSPVETYDSDVEFPWNADDSTGRSPPFEWEIKLPNFPIETLERKALPVRVERIFLSGDNKNLVGSIAVANLAFQKLVVVRFTLDYWKTTSEVVAEFNNDVRRKQTNDGFDRFSFSIKLADQANLENKTMFFCVRYNVNGQEYWDNNNSINFQVDFAKKAKPQNGKQGLGARPLNALPRSRPSTSSATGRPKSMPTSFDDFADGFDSYEFRPYRQPVAKLMGESPPPTVRLKAPKKEKDASEDPTRRKAGPQPFSNRYNFTASLSAALQAANNTLQGHSGLQLKTDSPESQGSYFSGPDPRTKHSLHQQASKASATVGSGNENIDGGSPNFPGSPLPQFSASDKPSVESSSYQELLNKYCFFGSAKSSPQLTKPPAPRTDGASDESSVSDFNLGSVTGFQSPASPQSIGSPVIEERTNHSPVGAGSPRRSRSTSPAPMTGTAIGTNMSSSATYGYPYQPMHSGFFESHPTAIRG